VSSPAHPEFFELQQGLPLPLTEIQALGLKQGFPSGSCPPQQGPLEDARCRRAGVQHVLCSGCCRSVQACKLCSGQFRAGQGVRSSWATIRSRRSCTPEPINQCFNSPERKHQQLVFDWSSRWLPAAIVLDRAQAHSQAAPPSPLLPTGQPGLSCSRMVFAGEHLTRRWVELDHGGVAPGDRAPAKLGAFGRIGDLNRRFSSKPLVRTLQKIGEKPRRKARRLRCGASRHQQRQA